MAILLRIPFGALNRNSLEISIDHTLPMFHPQLRIPCSCWAMEGDAPFYSISSRAQAPYTSPGLTCVFVHPRHILRRVQTCGCYRTPYRGCQSMLLSRFRGFNVKSNLGQLIMAIEAMYQPSITCVKLSCLLLLHRIFPNRRLHIILWCVGFVVVTISVVGVFTTIFGCRPIRYRVFQTQSCPSFLISLQGRMGSYGRASDMSRPQLGILHTSYLQCSYRFHHPSSPHATPLEIASSSKQEAAVDGNLPNG